MKIFVDLFLDVGPAVVGNVDGARQLDELGIKQLAGFLDAQGIFDLPQPLVDAAELLEQGDRPSTRSTTTS
jgi:hypothetical protein